MILLSTEEQLEVGDECRGQLAQGNIAYLVAMLDEFFQMVVNGAILPITALAFHLAHLFGVIFIVLSKYSKQGFMVLSHTQESISDLLCRHITISVHNLLISLVDAYSDFIQHSVGFLCNNASSRHSAEIDIPQLFLHIQFATELGNLAVYGDTAHYRYKPVLLRGIAFEIE